MKSREFIQENIFSAIKEKLPSHVSFVHEISELLGISYDSAYRRIRGDKELSLDELYSLCEKYRISLDTLFSVDSQNILFNSVAIGDQGVSFEHWLKIILEQLKSINQCKEKEVIYSATDIPLFHYLEFPDVLAFKHYFWHKVLLNSPGFEQEKFRPDIADELSELARHILSLYNKAPTIELWNEETFDSIIKQLGYCYDCRYFSAKEDLLRVLDSLEIMVNHLQVQAELGFRFMYGQPKEGIDGSYRLYCNEVLQGTNTIFVKSDERKIIFLTYNVINLLVTENPRICLQVETHLRTLTRKSILISSTSEKERHKFFHALTRKITELRSRIQ